MRIWFLHQPYIISDAIQLTRHGFRGLWNTAQGVNIIPKERLIFSLHQTGYSALLFHFQETIIQSQIAFRGHWTDTRWKGRFSWFILFLDAHRTVSLHRTQWPASSDERMLLIDKNETSFAQILALSQRENGPAVVSKGYNNKHSLSCYILWYFINGL